MQAKVATSRLRKDSVVTLARATCKISNIFAAESKRRENSNGRDAQPSGRDTRGANGSGKAEQRADPMQIASAVNGPAIALSSSACA